MKRIAILLLGFFFIISSVFKLFIYKDFVFYINEYLKLNSSFALFGASLIVSTELLIGGFLVLNYNVKYALYTSIFLLTILSFFLVYLSIFYPDAYCMCFGDINYLNKPIPSIFKNLVLLAYSAYLLRTMASPLHLMESSILHGTIITFLYIYAAFTIGISPVNVHYITLEELTKEDFNEIAIKYIFFDARTPNLYADEHILGAVSLPYYDIGMNLNPIKKHLKYKSKRIITYCDSIACTLSKKLAYSLSQKFNIKVYILKGGLENWKQFHLPTSID